MGNFQYLDKITSLKVTNRRINKYYGYIIWDTFNNPIFPVNFPKYDENDFLFGDYAKRFTLEYTHRSVDVLPWHFFVEFVNNNYMIYVTRPYNYMFPLTSVDCSNISENIVFNQIEVQDYIHIIILGDSNSDIYTPDIYFKIGKFIMSGYKSYMYSNTDNDIHLISMGNNFKSGLLTKYL